MKKEKFTLGIVFIAFILVAAACSGNGKKEEKAETAQQPLLVEVSIGGMTCTGCEQTIQTNLTKLEGVTLVKASFTTGTALVEYLPNLVDTVKMREAIAGSGYACKKFIVPVAR
jgi:copper chaperone CopZ